ncbi:AMH_1a_G0000760.mRNA.1.CDS.1 [Saccharomyces cerevisiae]|nr:EM14S01-3B_G0048770.mRNA.1.CDS.1 [Saccharomyces cerevisiae]CAI4240972.1 AMH_1a_G0000760.mRNA.1.CDS.1 [Saccharomyces cerevisiae]CAI6472442.1 AMH_1a_G0000760.mRNA.1.CDS.1 [Saccharomyces cerevisiae]
MHISLESTDTKLDTSNEPSAQLIEENVALPKDIFRSYLSYWIYEGAHSKPIMIMFLAVVYLMSLPNFRVYHLIPLLPSILCSSPQQINNKGFNTNLSSEVSTCKPSVKEEWRIITYKMNEYLFDHEIWSTPYYFYCEEDCHRYFLNFIEGRTFEKPTSNAEENVQETEAGESFTLNPGPDFQNCFSKTADIVEQSQVKYWQDIVLNEKCLRSKKQVMKSFNWYKTDRYFDQHNIFQHHNTAIEKTRYKLGMQTPSESTDAKSDSLDEPSAYLIEENVALPKDIFGSYLSYWIYEIARYTPVMILSLVIGVLVLLIIFFNDNEACVFNSAYFAFLSLVVLLIILGDGNPKLVSRRNFRTELLVDVITRKPAVEGKEWRIITYNMNQYLFNHGQWHTPYYFYSDVDCYRYFLRLVEGVTPKKQTAMSIGNSPVTAKPEDAIESASPSSRLNYRNFLLKAAEIERQAQENYWRRRHPNIDALLKKTE